MYDTFLKFPRYYQYERKKSVSNEAYIEQIAQRDNEEFAQECVRIHNRYRAQHGCPPLHLSYSICAVSQEWANRISKEDDFHHSNNPQYGENLFVVYMSNNSVPTVTAQQVVESWYSEHVFYPFDGHITRDIISNAGHFTQVLWKNSRELGIGKAISKNNRLYVVANYYPAGNILRRFTENVPPKIHNYSHMPHYYSRRISSRRLDMDTLAEDLHVPQYRRSSSRNLDIQSEISTGNLHAPHQYTRRVSSRRLDTSIETLHVPHFYNRRNSSKHLETEDSSAETLNVPQYYNSRRKSSKHLEADDSSAETLNVPQYYNSRRRSSKHLEADDSSAETLNVPQYYNSRRKSSKHLKLMIHQPKL
ncbi:Golgi-associated plant pathogenesis-related like protein [Argiope bruennichi]|uniref:Golgi-associated plant pathogenesis-related like protein n=1 Tax=Argiope bruennichi TaxID=94029 RepID=A0A8T0FI08_ARGBR|nr:Golgi-associated plant pathogenesis-related like protein [Argiope bruennichi]